MTVTGFPRVRERKECAGAALRTGSGNAGFCAMYRDEITACRDGCSSRDLEGHTRRSPSFPVILPS